MKSAEDHTGKLIDDLEEMGFLLDRGYVEKISGNFGALKRKGVSHAEIVRTRQHMVTEWPRIALSPQAALRDVRGENGRSFGKEGESGAMPGHRDDSTGSPASPAEVLEGLRVYDRNGDRYMRNFVGLAGQWDFRQDQRPPWPIYSQLGGTEEERARYLKRLQDFSRNTTCPSGAGASLEDSPGGRSGA